MERIAPAFVFVRKESVIHGLDPRVRLLLTFQLLTLSLLPSSLPEALGFLAGLLSLVASAKVLKRFLSSLSYTSVFALVVFLANLFSGATMSGSILPALRFLSLVGSGSVFFLTTSPDELEHVLYSLRVPREAIFAFTTAIRFIPVFMLDALRIMDAQRARGLELDKGNPARRLRNLFPVIVPLIMSAVMRSGELAEAMESRAFNSKKRRTAYLHFKYTKRDFTISLASLATFTFLVYQFLVGPW